MELASEQSLEGVFDGRTLEAHGVSWTFLRQEGAFVVERAESAQPAERLVVEYSFGVDPIQQLLVPRPGGRWQALPLAWDTRPAEQGGERWRSLESAETSGPVDPLHWEGLAYNWNSQCAACHSTGLHKAFDDETGAFETRWQELDIGCEACHGPGSVHVARAEAGGSGSGGWARPFAAADPDRWQRGAGQRIATPSGAPDPDIELEVCGPCHARREPLVDPAPPGAALLDGYRPRLLEPGLYFDDGQIREEVYVWGSFAQSRMYAAGVRCSDCHDPHALTLKRPGNSLCAGCHASEVFEAPGHRGHAGLSAEDSPGCIDCHMPARTYMQVDPRHDHSFPVPRPLRSQALGAPDVCAGCHPTHTPQALAAAITRWRGSAPAAPHWADALVAADGAPGPSRRWLSVATNPRSTDWLKGSAWLRYAEASGPAPPSSLLATRLSEGGPLERLGLLGLVGRLPVESRVTLLAPVLDDPLRALRVGAAEALLSVDPARIGPSLRPRFERALGEYRAAQRANAERPEAQLNLAGLARRGGDLAGARIRLDRALARAPYFVPAHVNRADLDRLEGKEDAALEGLRRALAIDPDNATVRYALGLALHRGGDPSAALAAFARAATAEPDQPTFTLGFALSLDAAGRREEAIEVLVSSVRAEQADAELYHALVSLLRDKGAFGEARQFAREWAQRFADDDRAPRLLRSLEGAASR